MPVAELKTGRSARPTLGRYLTPVALLVTIAWQSTITLADENPPASITNSIGMKFVRLPAGAFQMGSPFSEAQRSSDESRHEITLTSSYYIGVFEITQAQYERVIGSNPSGFTPQRHEDLRDTGRFPVEQVSWDDANEFCRTLSRLPVEAKAERVYRLPTEAEWEYACRGGTANVKTPFNIGDSLSSSQANFHGKYPYGKAEPGRSLQRTTTVGEFKPNAIGLYDMHGSVWEWCSDKYNRDYYLNGPKSDPRGPRGGERRIVRGGSWRNNAARCRAAFRGKYDPDARIDNVGFRVVLTIPEPDVNRE